MTVISTRVARRRCSRRRASFSGGTASTMRSCASDSQISQGCRPGYLSGTCSSSTRDAGVLAHLAHGRGEAARAAVGDGGVQALVAGHQDGVQHHLFGDGVADLHRAAGDLAGLVGQLDGGEGRAVQAVAAGAPAEHHDQIAGPGACADARPRARCPRSRSRPAGWPCSPASKQDGAVDGGDAHLVAVVLDAGHHAAVDAPRVQHAVGQLARIGRSSGPKQSTSVLAMGRAETPMMSRTTPPTPVLAPPKGSSAEGWLCVSTLKETSYSSSKSMMPALSTKAERTQGASISLRRRLQVGLDQAVDALLGVRRSAVVSRIVDDALEGLVDAVLGPGLGQGLQLDVGGLAPFGAEIAPGWRASRPGRATAGARARGVSSVASSSSRSGHGLGAQLGRAGGSRRRAASADPGHSTGSPRCTAGARRWCASGPRVTWPP